IVYCPVLILEPAHLALSLPRLIILIVAVICIQIGINDFYFVRCLFAERVLFFLVAAILFLGAPFQGHILFICFGLGLAIFIALTLNQLRRRESSVQGRAEEKAPVPSGE
ncbi:MAG: hypothetical protein JRJ85_07140, partial [Deltaproteobacteria bacterium]|nr:hypothetical protein [Deltaproteobacteria bacterium]